MNTWSEKTLCDTFAVFCKKETFNFHLAIKSKVFLIKLKRIKSELVSNFLIEHFSNGKFQILCTAYFSHKIISILEISWLQVTISLGCSALCSQVIFGCTGTRTTVFQITSLLSPQFIVLEVEKVRKRCWLKFYKRHFRILILLKI